MIARLPKTIAEIRQANKDIGGHFFDAETMKTFRSTIEQRVFLGRKASYFVTSESYDNGKTRAFNLRKCDAAGRVTTIMPSSESLPTESSTLASTDKVVPLGHYATRDLAYDAAKVAVERGL